MADLPADQYIDVEKLNALGLNSSDYTVAGEVLTFAPLLADWIGSGLSDLQVAQMIDWAAAGTTAQWAGQTLYDDAGIAGTFDIRDPYFYDFLRQQSGWLINPSGVGVIDYLRRDMAETMWSLMGGDVGPGISVTALARELAQQYGPDLAEGTRYSADYRAYMIAVTETARAESFAEFVAAWTLGAKQKVWVANAGACQICAGNVDAGPINLTEWFPSRDISPPAHPLCRCSLAPWVPDTFNPDDWVSRSPSDLDPLLFNWAGTQWPDVDLMAELPDLDESDFEMAQTAEETRTGRMPRRKRAKPTTRILAAYDVAVQMLAVTERAAQAWARHAHVRYPPQSERELYALVQRLRKGHDELPDAREATEHYIVALREGLRDVLRAAATEAKAGA